MTRHEIGALVFGIVLAGLLFWVVVSSMSTQIVVRVGQ